MNCKKKIISAFIIILLSFLSKGYSQAYLDSTLSADKRVDDLLSRMTRKEKVGQLCQYASPDVYDSLDFENLKQLAKESKVGSFLSITEPDRIRKLQKAALQTRLKIPLLMATDAIHGMAMHRGATVYPIPISLASTWDTSLANDIARKTAIEMRENGLHWTFSPNVDLSRDPRWGRTGETFGEDPLIASRMGKAMVKGYQRAPRESKVAACAKHFVAGGNPVNGVNFAPMNVGKSYLNNLWLPPFETLINSNVSTIMAAHNEINGKPCHSNKALLTHKLKEQMEFDGFIVTDWTDIERLRSVHSSFAEQKQAVNEAVDAGIDMNMHGPGFYKHVLELIEEGKISEQRINQACKKILALKIRLGLFENPYPETGNKSTKLFNKEHKKLALEAAREGIVLLKNENNFLPLKKSEEKILVTGPNADNRRLLGDWTTKQPQENVITVKEGFQKLFGEQQVDYINSGESLRNPQEEKMQKAVNQASNYSTVIAVVGSNSLRYQWDKKTSGENSARGSIDLFGKQLQLVKQLYRENKNVIVVLINSRPIAEPWIKENIPAIIEAWEPGAMGGQAIAEIVQGQVNPSGKLTASFPYSVGQVVYTYNHKPSHYHRKYEDIPSEPLFRFGHGLSYTEFNYNNLSLSDTVITKNDSTTISIDVRNVGDREGKEIVQLYIRDKYCSLTRPVKELKDFKKINLKPGENRTLSFDITRQKLGQFNNKGNFILETGEFTIFIGSSSDNNDLKSATLFVRDRP